MNRSLALILALAWAALPLGAAARDFVQDQAGMFSPATVTALNTRIGNFNAQTGKEIVVMTVPSLGSSTLQSAADAAFTQQSVNGVLVFVARNDRRDIIVPDKAGMQAGWFTPDVLRTIRQSMETQFRSENYDAGITAAVGGILNVYRAHLGSSRARPGGAGVPMTSPAAPSNGGFHLSMFWWIVIAVVGFLIVRSILRSMAPRPPYAGVPGAPGPGGPPAPGYGPGYGAPGYGYGGGGGSFWSGLLGGLGGAWLGNEMFGQHGGGGMAGPADAGQMQAGDAGGGWGGDAGGWQSDAGQAGAGSAGDWSGGGFGDGGGGGDFGGGGDAGGGW